MGTVTCIDLYQGDRWELSTGDDLQEFTYPNGGAILRSYVVDDYSLIDTARLHKFEGTGNPTCFRCSSGNIALLTMMTVDIDILGWLCLDCHLHWMHRTVYYGDTWHEMYEEEEYEQTY